MQRDGTENIIFYARDYIEQTLPSQTSPHVFVILHYAIFPLHFVTLPLYQKVYFCMKG